MLAGSRTVLRRSIMAAMPLLAEVLGRSRHG
jgi:hypothetical protein